VCVCVLCHNILADHTAHAIWHHIVVSLSLRPSVCNEVYCG